MAALIEELKNLRNKAGCGHPRGWELMRDTMDAAIKLVEEKFTSTNEQSTPCPYHYHTIGQYGYDHFCNHPDRCEWSRRTFVKRCLQFRS